MPIVKTILTALLVSIVFNIVIPLQAEEPDAYTKEGYCIVNTPEQILRGLNRFASEAAFKKQCKGKMIFQFQRYRCLPFVSNEMHFPILLIDANNTYYLDVNSSQTVCGKTIIETVVKDKD